MGHMWGKKGMLSWEKVSLFSGYHLDLSRTPVGFQRTPFASPGQCCSPRPRAEFQANG